MNRRKARENAFIAMFEVGFGGEISEIIAYSREEAGEYSVDEFGEGLLNAYGQNQQGVNDAITAKLKGWTVGRLPRVSLAILRLAVTEMLYLAPDMHSIIINEAVELSKKYGDDADYQFINGVLGNISRESTGEKPEGEQGE